jgi:hypothetical protein
MVLTLHTKLTGKILLLNVNATHGCRISSLWLEVPLVVASADVMACIAIKDNGEGVQFVAQYLHNI